VTVSEQRQKLGQLIGEIAPGYALAQTAADGVQTGPVVHSFEISIGVLVVNKPLQLIEVFLRLLSGIDVPLTGSPGSQGKSPVLRGNTDGVWPNNSVRLPMRVLQHPEQTEQDNARTDGNNGKPLPYDHLPAP